MMFVLLHLTDTLMICVLLLLNAYLEFALLESVLEKLLEQFAIKPTSVWQIFTAMKILIDALL
jgi:DNA integrity scanning protein DisA with diadenylate cyclase activity